MGDQSKTIFRTVKRENPYVLIDKTVLNDNRLSWKAKGLMAFLLSKPDDWVININNLVKQAKDGRDSVYAAIKELRELGYLQQIEKRDSQGRISFYEYLVYENPQLSDQPITPINENKEIDNDKQNASLNPLPENPYTAKPFTGNPTLLNNDLLLKNDLTKNSPSNSPKLIDREGDYIPDLFLLEPIAIKLFGQTNNEILNNLWSCIKEFKIDPDVVEECLKIIDAKEIKYNPYGYFRGKYAVCIAIIAKRAQIYEQQKQLEELIKEQDEIPSSFDTTGKSTEEIIADIKRNLGITKNNGFREPKLETH